MTATFPEAQSASRTIPYVPAPRVLPNRYCDLCGDGYYKEPVRGEVRGAVLLLVTLRLPRELTEHAGDCRAVSHLVEQNNVDEVTRDVISDRNNKKMSG